MNTTGRDWPYRLLYALGRAFWLVMLAYLVAQQPYSGPAYLPYQHHGSSSLSSFTGQRHHTFGSSASR